MFKSLVATALASVASGHMLMNTPTPYSSPALVNSPLSADGSNFPCQLTSGQTLSGGSNTMELGSVQPLQFTGEAVHGGGSCQISLTYDSSPSASSTWKVIESYEGGCPAQGQSGNMGSDASATDPYTYNFTIPDNIPTGDVTLAWTWFNKIGNREMYMNCAPVTLTGTSGDESNFDALPDMFVANIGNGCGTVDSTDLLFPNPGDQVQMLNGATSAFSTPTGTGCQASSSGAAATTSTKAAGVSVSVGVSVSASLGGIFVTSSPATAASSTSTTTALTTTTKSVVSPTATPVTTSTSSTATSSTATSSTATSSTATSSTATSSTATAAAATGFSSVNSTGGTEETGSACSTEGTWNCLGDSYQRCSSGVWSAVMELAAGTECTVGESTSINIVAASKRTVRVAMPFKA